MSNIWLNAKNTASVRQCAPFLDLSANETYLLYYLAGYSNDDGTNIWPSHERIIKETKLSWATVKRSLSELIKKEILLKSPRKKRASINYSLNLVLLDLTIKLNNKQLTVSSNNNESYSKQLTVSCNDSATYSVENSKLRTKQLTVSQSNSSHRATNNTYEKYNGSLVPIFLNPSQGESSYNIPRTLPIDGLKCDDELGDGLKKPDWGQPDEKGHVESQAPRVVPSQDFVAQSSSPPLTASPHGVSDGEGQLVKRSQQIVEHLRRFDSTQKRGVRDILAELHAKCAEQDLPKAKILPVVELKQPVLYQHSTHEKKMAKNAKMEVWWNSLSIADRMIWIDKLLGAKPFLRGLLTAGVIWGIVTALKLFVWDG